MQKITASIEAELATGCPGSRSASDVRRPLPLLATPGLTADFARKVDDLSSSGAQIEFKGARDVNNFERKFRPQRCQ